MKKIFNMDLDFLHHSNKFFGISMGKNFNIINDDLINFIIDKKIYIPSKNKLNRNNKIQKSYSDLKKDFIFESVYYELNPKICLELFEYYKVQIKIYEIKTLAYFRNSVQSRLIGIENDFDVLKILKKSRINLTLESIDYVLQLDDFINILQKELQNSELFESILKFEFLETEIQDYLTSNIILREGKFLQKWKKLQSQNIRLKYYNKKILELENAISHNHKIAIETKNPLNKIIFKDNAELIFWFIIQKYPKEKNASFFSYLYFYFKDNLKMLQIVSKDSTDYREYIIGIFKIQFSRIQDTTSKIPFKKNEINFQFDNYVKEYHSVKSEVNLNNNE